MTIAIVDTSVLCELLGVPGKSGAYDATSDFELKRDAGERFVLPAATVIETGNHIAQAGDGAIRREVAGRFVQLVRLSLEGATPFDPGGFPVTPDAIAGWLGAFVEDAMCGVGLGDRSIIALWDEMRVKNALRRVYIWTIDRHLQGYDTLPQPH